LKGNWSLRQRQRLPLRNSPFAIAPSFSPSLGGEFKAKGHRLWGREQKDFIFGIILTHLFMTKGEDKHFEGSNDSVFGDSCQRGRKCEPKAKGPHHHQFQKLNAFQEYLGPHHHQFQKLNAFQEYLSIGIQFQKLNAFQEYLSIGILKGGQSSISKMIYQNPLEH
jgi:hypothetical protein